MDENNPDTNPLNFLSAEEIILFWRNTDPEQWKYYTGILREQNCFNPLIAAYIKRMGGIDRYTLIGLNSTYFCRLHFIRKGVLKKEPGRALHALAPLWKAFQKESISFLDFMEFKGIFSECRWILRTAPDSEPIHDVIFNGDHFDGWTEFIQPGNAPKDALIEIFGDIINIKTEEMGALGFKNPLAQIIQNKIEPDTFANAMNKRFLALFWSQKVAQRTNALVPGSDSRQDPMAGEQEIGTGDTFLEASRKAGSIYSESETKIIIAGIDAMTSNLLGGQRKELIYQGNLTLPQQRRDLTKQDIREIIREELNNTPQMSKEIEASIHEKSELLEAMPLSKKKRSKPPHRQEADHGITWIKNHEASDRNKYYHADIPEIVFAMGKKGLEEFYEPYKNARSESAKKMAFLRQYRAAKYNGFIMSYYRPDKQRIEGYVIVKKPIEERLKPIADSIIQTIDEQRKASSASNSR